MQVADDERADWAKTDVVATDDAGAATEARGADEPPAAPTADVLPELPLATRLKLAHAEECEAKGREAQAAKFEYLAAKEEAKEKKAIYMKHLAELEAIASRGPNPQATLPFVDPDDVARHAATAPAAVPSDEWKMRPLSDLQPFGVPASLVAKMVEHGVATIGALKELWDRNGKPSDFKGVGAAKDLTLADAFADYGVAHPEVFGQPPLPAVEPTPANEDPFADEQPTGAPPADAASSDVADASDESPFDDEPSDEGVDGGDLGPTDDLDDSDLFDEEDDDDDDAAA